MNPDYPLPPGFPSGMTPRESARALRYAAAGAAWRFFVWQIDRWAECQAWAWLQTRRTADVLPVLGIVEADGPLATRVRRDSAHMHLYLNERTGPDGSSQTSTA